MDDKETARQLIGRWDGNWEIGEYSGRFALVVTAAQGTDITGEAYWYDTASLIPNEALINATVEHGALTAEQPSGLKIRIEPITADTLTGTWKFNRFKGNMQATRSTD